MRTTHAIPEDSIPIYVSCASRAESPRRSDLATVPSARECARFSGSPSQSAPATGRPQTDARPKPAGGDHPDYTHERCELAANFHVFHGLPDASRQPQRTAGGAGSGDLKPSIMRQRPQHRLDANASREWQRAIRCRREDSTMRYFHRPHADCCHSWRSEP